MKITYADSVPELVFQPVKITSADSAGQCYKSFIRSLIKKISMKSFIRSFVRRSFVRSFIRSCIRSLIDKLYKVLYKDLYKELLMGVPEIIFQPVKITSADSVPEIVFSR